MATSSPPKLAHVEVLRTRMTPARFDKYVAAVGGDAARALQLYEWNNDVASAFHGSIGQFEVLLRNALDAQLVRYHKKVLSGDGKWWKDAAMPFQHKQNQNVTRARSSVQNSGAVETHGKVVAELMFGFWRFLCDAQHSATLWAPALRHAFPHLRPKARPEVYNRLETLNGLRNRIAHNEPVHHLPLEERWQDLLTVGGWICPTTAAWMWSTSRIPATLAARP